MEMLKILFDFGMVVLIWMTQLIVYPGFRYYEEKTLINWHKIYTLLITFIVAPLMFGQMGMHLFTLTQQFNLLNAISLLLVIICWLLTFTWAVPLHRKIDQGHSVNLQAKKLVRMNRYRTFGWTLIFCISITQYYI